MKKTLFLFIALVTSTLLFAASKADIEKAKIESWIEQSSTGVLKGVVAIGSVQQSILTEAQFQAQMGTEWVAMKGQSVAGTKICVTYSLCTLPDARSRFLRNSDAANTNLRGLVSDTTAINGIGGSAAGQTLGTTNISLASGSALSAGSHTHGVSAYYTAYNQPGAGGEVGYNDGNGILNPLNKAVFVTINSAGSHTHTVSGTTNIGHSHPASIVTLTGGGSETAPDHIIVNTFVKVD